MLLLLRRPEVGLFSGDVVIQPPSEDRVSIFVTLIGAKSAVLKVFSTGKVPPPPPPSLSTSPHPLPFRVHPGRIWWHA